jgi:hypothetical protein
MKQVMGCVEIYDDFLTEDQAKKIIDAIENIDKDPDFKMSFEDAGIGKGHKGGNIRTNQLFPISKNANLPGEARIVRDAIKDGKDNYIRDLKNIQELLANKLQIYVKQYCDKYEVNIHFDEGYTLLRYQGGQEYKAHCDYAPHNPRHLSALILLNPTEYKGGGTYFSHFDEMVKPDKPALVLFPSNYAYSHKAMPVLEGTKYAIVTWLGHQIDFDGLPPMYIPEGVNISF